MSRLHFAMAPQCEGMSPLLEDARQGFPVIGTVRYLCSLDDHLVTVKNGIKSASNPAWTCWRTGGNIPSPDLPVPTSIK